jgi:hypothetical protein
MVSHNWAANGSKVTDAMALHLQAEELKRQSEEAYNKRNALMGDINESVKASRDLLTGVYRETPKVLNEFGFDVSNSVRTAAKKQA